MRCKLPLKQRARSRRPGRVRDDVLTHHLLSLSPPFTCRCRRPMVGLPRPDAGTYGTGRTFRHPEGGTVNLRTQATETPGLEPVTMAERRERLAWLIANEAKRGWHVESQMDYQATLAKGHRPNHLLHLILTVLTLGAWLLVWIPVSIFTSESRKVVTIDGYGRIV